MALAAAPPAYTSIDVQPPPRYLDSAEQAPAIEPDAKQPVVDPSAEPRVERGLVFTNTEEASREPLATVTSSLQPFSRIKRPASTPIPEASWNSFVADMRNSVAPSGGEKALAILAGAGVSLGTCAPFFGACVGGLVWKRAVEKRVRQSFKERTDDTSIQVISTANSKRVDTREPINRVVEQYNEAWAPLGVRVRLEGITKAEGQAGLMCHCDNLVSSRRGCGGCCGHRCNTCGKWRTPKGGKLRQEVSREIVRVIVETVGAEGNAMTSTNGYERADGVGKESWVDDQAY